MTYCSFTVETFHGPVGLDFIIVVWYTSGWLKVMDWIAGTWVGLIKKTTLSDCIDLSVFSAVVSVLDCNESVGIEEMVVGAADPSLLSPVVPLCPGASGFVTGERTKLAFVMVVRIYGESKEVSVDFWLSWVVKDVSVDCVDEAWCKKNVTSCKKNVRM